jgi:ABC-type phosphate/phosphonate transport system substrate-binding protein
LPGWAIGTFLYPADEGFSLSNKSKPTIRAFLFFYLCLVGLSGCGNAASTSSPGSEKGAQPEKSLLIGLIPEQNIFKQMERYEPLANYLAGKIGIHVKLKVLTRYGNIDESEDFDLVDVNPDPVSHFFIVVDGGHDQPVARL